MIDTRTLKRDDVVVVDDHSWLPQLILTCGPRTFDLIEQCGGTSRRRHGANVRLATAADFNHDSTYEADVRRRLEHQAADARAERKTGARVRRGLVSPKR